MYKMYSKSIQILATQENVKFPAFPFYFPAKMLQELHVVSALCIVVAEGCLVVYFLTLLICKPHTSLIAVLFVCNKIFVLFIFVTIFFLF